MAAYNNDGDEAQEEEIPQENDDGVDENSRAEHLRQQTTIPVLSSSSPFTPASYRYKSTPKVEYLSF